MRSLPHLGLNAPALVAALGAVLATLAAPAPASAGQISEPIAMQASTSEIDVSVEEASPAARAPENTAPIGERPSAPLAPLASQPASDASGTQHAATLDSAETNDATPDAAADAAEDGASRPIKEATSQNGLALDDTVLSRQRGSGLGEMTVAATPGTMQGAGSVTLWDEIVPPAPLP
ncbi:MAG TPA: hypothetical protein VGZ01_11400, partial [Trinickia sp.]|nr:hypothetical protein [Trinickia sp.]